MFTKRNLIETAVINEFIRYSRLSPNDIHEAIVAHGLDKKLERTPTNFIRSICITIQRAFRKHDIRFFTFSATLDNVNQYQMTNEARLFCEEHLQQPIYDENGNFECNYIQHPDSLKAKWRMLI
tara:strand:- start:462 stop:833 length:372 start_codon:yes stop_codon:yes gene_type:complete